jgi:beta-glucosidase-like glycosyl hydrolase
MYTIGAQTGEDTKFLKTAVTLKHDFAYSLENSDSFTRHNFNAIVSNATMMDTYFVAFRAAITNSVSPARGMMCSYNAVNSVPSVRERASRC